LLKSRTDDLIVYYSILHNRAYTPFPRKSIYTTHRHVALIKTFGNFS
jgi:hypothetical protein